jgi:acetylglutamate kinase
MNGKPDIKQMKKVTVIKIGGSTMSSRDTTIEDLVALQGQGKALVVVHGGGNTVTDWLKRQGVATQFVRGERVTDAETLEVAIAVLAGLVNKEIVATINNRGGKAVGISGIDGSLIEGKAKNQEMGYVGEAVNINPAILETLLASGFMPVVSPMSLYAVARPADAAQILNINADPTAGELAVALGAEKLIFLTNVGGINDASGKVIPGLTAGEAHSLVASGVIAGGMIPKLNACLGALNAGALARIIDGRKQHVLMKEFEGHGGGTTIYKESND